MPASVFGQDGYRVRLEWGADAVAALAPRCAVTIIVDVLSFTTSVDIAVGRGARVWPLPWSVGAAEAAEAARRTGATLAVGRSEPGWSLAPSSLVDLPADTLLALPSPNGATLSTRAASISGCVLAGCLRNAAAVAEAAIRLADGGAIAVIPSAERWGHVGALRPSVEDYLGAAAIAAAVTAVTGGGSPEVELAVAALGAVRDRLPELITECVSGRELVERGFGRDVELAIARDVSTSVPILDNELHGRGIYRRL